jgi:hypothetical protein
LLASLSCLLLIQTNVLSQTQDPPRYEVAAEFYDSQPRGV